MATIIPVAVTLFTVIAIVGGCGDTSECTHSNIEVLSQFIDARINAAVNARVTEEMIEVEFKATVDERMAAIVNTTFSALTVSVDERIRALNTTISGLNVKAARLKSQPVIEILYFNLRSDLRRVVLRPISTATLKVGRFISDPTLSIPNLSNEYTSDDNILAYRPNYSSHSGGNTAILFVNLEAVISCYQANSIGPACHLFTLEEDSFRYGRPFIQASDNGSYFRIFSDQNDIATYGFGITGCSIFDSECLLNLEVSLVCLLPPALNQCG